MRPILRLLFIICVVKENIADDATRDERNIGLFNVVVFDNDVCSSQDTTAPMGICYTAEECQNNGGTASGNCAFGFGVCCLTITSSCGGTITRNITYFRNPGFPTAYAPTTIAPCTYTFDANADVCQIRLDFLMLSTSSPPNGQCGNGNTDKIVTTSPDGSTPPGPGGLCGSGLTGQHMYIETSGGNPTFDIQLGSTAIANRMWNIRATQIECSNPSRAPPGCVQYFTGITGRIMSFNFPGDLITSDQSYMSCVRRELGRCTITYSAPGENDFLLMATIAIKSQDSSIAIDCAITSVQIPGTGAPIDAFCGGKFNAATMEEVSGSITSSTIPFAFNTVTANGLAVNTFKGYNLLYVQNPC